MGNPTEVYRLFSLLERLAIYGIFGFAAEISFTAIWDAVENGNRKLLGVSSMYIFFVYGLAILIIERLFLALKQKLGLLLRGIFYVIVCYTFEFCFGYFLNIWDACPWDYASYFNYHYMGLITLEYIPVWFFASLFCEQYLICAVLNVGWINKAKSV